MANRNFTISIAPYFSFFMVSIPFYSTKAFALFVLAMAIVLGVTMILSVAEPEQQFIDLLYEASSAIGTAGITTGVTQQIGTLSKFVIMLAMYFGRLGPITVFLALMKKNKKAGIRYPEAKILIA